MPITLTPPTPLDAIPPYPDPNDRPTFAPRAFDWSRHLNVSLSPQLQALADNVYDNAVAAKAQGQLDIDATAQSAAQAAGSANAAAGSAASAEGFAANAASASDSPKWLPGTVYAEGDTAWSPANSITHRRTAASPGASAIDPALDRLRWMPLAVAPSDLLLAAILLY